MTNQFAKPINNQTMDKSYRTISFARITDFIIIVAIASIAAFVWGYKRSHSVAISMVTAFMFLLFACVFMYSINIKVVHKKQEKIACLANKLYLQSQIINGSNIQFGNLLLDILEDKDYKYMPESGSGYRLSKDKKFYFLYPYRRHNSHAVTGQDVMFACDIARRKRYKRIIIAASCDIDPVALEFAQIIEDLEVLMIDMDTISSLFIETYEEIPEKKLEKYIQTATLEVNQTIQKRRSLVKLLPSLRYLFCGLMLFFAASFMPFNTFYVVAGGICMVIFVLLLLFPTMSRHKQDTQ